MHGKKQQNYSRHDGVSKTKVVVTAFLLLLRFIFAKFSNHLVNYCLRLWCDLMLIY